MTPREKKIAGSYLREAIHQLSEGAIKINHCLDQLSDEQLWWRPTQDQNSVANLLLHLAGNLRQWIVSGVDGEPDVRDRPREFNERGPIVRGKLIRGFQQTVDGSIQALQQCPAERLIEPRRIQGFDTTTLSAIFDSVAHFRGHVQEIICLTRQQLGAAYHFHFVPQTEEQGA